MIFLFDTLILWSTYPLICPVQFTKVFRFISIWIHLQPPLNFREFCRHSTSALIVRSPKILVHLHSNKFYLGDFFHWALWQANKKELFGRQLTLLQNFIAVLNLVTNHLFLLQNLPNHNGAWASLLLVLGTLLSIYSDFHPRINSIVKLLLNKGDVEYSKEINRAPSVVAVCPIVWILCWRCLVVGLDLKFDQYQRQFFQLEENWNSNSSSNIHILI